MTEVLLTKIATVRRKEQSLGVGMALTLGTAYLVIALAVVVENDIASMCRWGTWQSPV